MTMTQEEQNLYDWLLNGPVQTVLKEYVKEHPVKSYKDVVFYMSVNKTWPIGDSVYDLLREQISELSADRKITEDVLFTYSHRMAKKMEEADSITFGIIKSSKLPGRIIRDNPKALRNKKLLIEVLQFILNEAALNLWEMYRGEPSSAAEQILDFAAKHKKDLSPFINSLADAAADQETFVKNLILLSPASSCLLAALIDPSSSRECLDRLSLFPIISKDLCEALDKHASQVLESLNQLMFERLNGKETVQTTHAESPKQTSARRKSKDRMPDSVRKALEISADQENKKARQGDAIFDFLRIMMNCESSDKFYSISLLYSAAAQEAEKSWFGLSDEELSDFMHSIPAPVLEAAMEAYSPCQNRIGGPYFLMFALQTIGCFNRTADQQLDRLNRLQHPANPSFMTAIEELSSLYDQSVPSEDPEEENPYISLPLCWITTLFMDLLYTSRLRTEMNQEFYNSILEILFEADLQKQNGMAERSIEEDEEEDPVPVIGDGMNATEWMFSRSMYSVLKLAWSDPEIRKKLIRSLRSNILKSSQKTEQLMVSMAEEKFFSSFEFFPSQAALFLIELLENRWFEASLSPYCALLQKDTFSIWRHIRKSWSLDSLEIQLKNQEVSTENIELLMNESLSDLDKEEEEIYARLLSMEMTYNTSHLSFGDSPESRIAMKDLVSVFCFLVKINADDELKEEFLQTPPVFRKFIVRHLMLSAINIYREYEHACHEAQMPAHTERIRLQNLGLYQEKSQLEKTVQNLRENNSLLKQELENAANDGYQKGVKETEDRLFEEIRNLKKELAESRKQNAIDENEKQELYQLRELLFTNEQDDSPSADTSAPLRDDEAARIDTYLKTHRVVFAGGHYKQCAELKKKYPGFRVYFDEQIPAEVISSADLIIVFYKWISHGTYYRVKKYGSRHGQPIPIEYIGEKNIIASERRLLSIIENYE